MPWCMGWYRGGADICTSQNLLCCFGGAFEAELRDQWFSHRWCVFSEAVASSDLVANGFFHGLLGINSVGHNCAIRLDLVNLDFAFAGGPSLAKSPLDLSVCISLFFIFKLLASGLGFLGHGVGVDAAIKEPFLLERFGFWFESMVFCTSLAVQGLDFGVGMAKRADNL